MPTKVVQDMSSVWSQALMQIEDFDRGILLEVCKYLKSDLSYREKD